MSKHRAKHHWSYLWGILNYPIPVYKHWFLNNWNYFTKPKISAKVAEYAKRLRSFNDRAN
jgi:hypothetical protein